jgi:hypothetical protein
MKCARESGDWGHGERQLLAYLRRFACSKTQTGETKYLSLLLFFVKLEGNYDVFAAVEAGESARIGSQVFGFGVKLVIDVGIKATEAIVARSIGDIGPDSQRADIFQVNHG